MNNKIPDEVHEYFSNIGKKSGNKLKEEIASGIRDKDYFSKISKMRKSFGRQKSPTES